jgi:acyl-coenzyme A thioesterase PaaI-like protein
MSPVLQTYRRLQRWPAGNWLFSRLVCLRAPYFASIRPRIDKLAAGECVVSVRHRRAVTNHLGTVHAIALCNMAELAAGVGTDVSVPAGMRWIPKGMTVEYLKKATGDLRATARLDPLPQTAAEGYGYVVPVSILDRAEEMVFRAQITMWISPRKSDAARE